MSRYERILRTYCSQCGSFAPAAVRVLPDDPTMPWRGEALCAACYAAALAAEAGQ